jgi:hypothetical protein
MEDFGGQFGSIPEANPTTDATAKDFVQSKKAPGSSHGHMADTPAGAACFGSRRNSRLSS